MNLNMINFMIVTNFIALNLQLRSLQDLLITII
jgi:hypothetical protein